MVSLPRHRRNRLDQRRDRVRRFNGRHRSRPRAWSATAKPETMSRGVFLCSTLTTNAAIEEPALRRKVRDQLLPFAVPAVLSPGLAPPCKEHANSWYPGSSRRRGPEDDDLSYATASGSLVSLVRWHSEKPNVQGRGAVDSRAIENSRRGNFRPRRRLPRLQRSEEDRQALLRLAPETYNLDQIIAAVKAARNTHPSE